MLIHVLISNYNLFPDDLWLIWSSWCHGNFED